MYRFPTLILGIFFIMPLGTGLWGQKIKALSNAQMRFKASAEAKDVYSVDGCDPAVSAEDSAIGINRFTVNGATGVSGNAFSSVKVAPSGAFTTCDARARAGASVVLRELKDSLLRLEFDLQSVVELDCGDPSGQRCDWYARGEALLEGYIDLIITGYNQGQDYAFYYYGKASSQTHGRSEGSGGLGREDTCFVNTEGRILRFDNQRVRNVIDSAQGVPFFARFLNGGRGYNLSVPDGENRGFTIDDFTRHSLIEDPIGHYRTFTGPADTVRLYVYTQVKASIHDPAKSIGAFFPDLAD